MCREDAGMKLEVLKTIPNVVAHCIDNGNIWASSNFSVVCINENTNSINKVYDLPVPLRTRLIGKIRLPSRLLRLGIRSMRVLQSGTLLVNANRRIYRISGDQIEETLRFSQGVGPLRYGWCEDPDGVCYLGEYYVNNERAKPIRLFKSENDGKEWTAVHEFWDVKHIHCVQYDPYSGLLWLSSGDRDDESKIVFSSDGGVTWTPIGSGDQMFRSVSLIFTPEYVYWGSDAPTRQNYIYRYSRQGGEILAVQPVNGPVHYSTTINGGVYLFGTTIEGNSEGPSAQWDKNVRIWGSSDGLHWKSLLQWEKDDLPYEFFGYGRVLFPVGDNHADEVYFTTLSVKKFDNTLFHARVKSELVPGAEERH